MPLSPEEIENQRFREVLRGYDKGQVEAMLVTLADRHRAALQGGDAASSGPTGADGVDPSHFDDALRGYDKEGVRSFFDTVAADFQAVAGPDASRRRQADDQGPGPTAAERAGEDLGLSESSARDVGSAMWAAAESEADTMRALAAEEAAKTLEEAWRQRDEAIAARAAVAEEQAGAAARRAEAERMLAVVGAEVNAALSLGEKAEADAGAAAAELAAVREDRGHAAAQRAAAADELELARSLRAEAEVELDRSRTARLAMDRELAESQALTAAASESASRAHDAEVEAARLTVAVRHQVEQELSAARRLRQEPERDAADVRAVAERDAAATREEGDRHARQITEKARSEAQDAAALLTELGGQLDAFRTAGGQQLSEAVRRLEDQILAAVGEIQEELQHSSSHGLALVKEAEQRVRATAKSLADLAQRPAP